MSEITLEKVDKVKERAFVTYAEAKEALEHTNGDILEALIYIEEKQKNEYNKKCEENKINENNNTESVEELKEWLKDIVRKGNVSRIKIKKDGKVLVDIPINAGIAVGAIAFLIPQLLAIGVITAIATNLVIEITKTDGSVEVVNKMIKKATRDFTEKAKVVADDIKDIAKDKVKDVKDNVSHNIHDKTDNIVYKVENDSNYTYTVNFDEPEK